MDRIDIEPLKPGWGCIWQGSELDDWFDKVPSPKCVVSMVGDCSLGPAIVCAMLDNDTTTLSDRFLLAMCDASVGFLKNGYNLLIHCIEGKYRSTYMDIAIHMRAGMSLEEAFERIKARHPIAALRNGTGAQLRQLESTLKGD